MDNIVAQLSCTRKTLYKPPPNAASLPPELAELPCFVTYVAEPATRKDGTPKVNKIPHDPNTGRKARANDPSTWSGIAMALAAQERYGHAGIGIEFSKDFPFWGADLDNCRNPETGEIAPWAQKIVDRFRPYCFIEPSPSGTGLHIIGRGEKPSWTFEKKGGIRKGPVEFYPGGQFLTLTLTPLFPCPALIDCTTVLDAWLRETWPEHYDPQPEAKRQSIAPTLSADDAEILNRCMGNEKFRRLHAGDNSDYDDDESRGDLAFCNLVARNHGTPEQADNLLQQSARMREKWNRADYRKWTLDRSFDGTVIPFTPTPRLVAHEHAGPNPQDAALVSDDAPCDAKLGAALRELERLRQENARLVAQNDQLHQDNTVLRGRVQLADQQLATYRNAKLGASKAVGAALIEVFRYQEPHRPDERAGYRMPLDRLADRTGQSADACSRQIKQLAKYKTPDGAPLLNVIVKSVGAGVNSITGEIGGDSGPHKELWIGPGVAPEVFGQILATLDPGEDRKPWGGKTADNRCVDHPDDGVIERTTYLQKTTYECATCNEILDEQIIPVAGRHPKIRFLPAIPTPQDAASTSVDGIYTGKLRHRETAPLFPGPTSDEVARGLQIWSGNGLNVPPADRYTDVTIGGRQ